MVDERSIRTHLVGSLPFADAREAMAEAIERLGATLPALPDGETGERGNYVMHIVDRLAANPALSARATSRRIGGQSIETKRFSVRRGHSLEIPLGELGYFRDWEASLPLFRELRDKHGYPELRYQLCVAPALSIALLFFQPPFSVRAAIGPLKRAIRAELAAAISADRGAVAIQLDAAAEQILVAAVERFAPPLADAVARRIGRQIASHAVDVPHDVPLGVHLCLRNPGNRRAITPRTSRPIVRLANATIEAFEAVRPLDYLHIPLVDTADPQHYESLRDLRVPETTRLVAGLVYEDGHEANRERLRLASEALGFTPDVACACGMGRRTPEVARELLDEMRVLADPGDQPKRPVM